MTQSLLSIAVFLGLLACLPMAVKWLKTRSGYTPLPTGDQAVVVSAVAVGPHQRVVTVEVGPQDARVRLTLGVTAQSITCLHSAALTSNAVVSS
jgi:flagellar protein FliO/FliZ